MEAFRWRVNVILALILRDIRTRFGRSYLGYLLVIGWPLTHLGVIVGFVTFANRVIPLGDDPSVFVGTGVLPYILCLYPAKMIGYAFDNGRSLFLFPVVKVFDIIIARTIVETITAFIVVIVFATTMYILDVDIFPNNIYTLSSFVISIIFFSISMGIINAILASLFKMWHVVFVVIMAILYVSSGVFILPSSLPQNIRDILWFNPLLHFVEWIRSAYYEGYGDDMLSKSYVLWMATVFIMIGLAGERFARGKLLTA